MTRHGGIAWPELRIEYRLSGAAIPGQDYEQLSGTVTLAAGQASADIEIVALDDLLVEGDEAVLVTVLDGPGYYAGNPSAAGILIYDDDAPVVTVVASAPEGAEHPGAPITFHLARTLDPTDPLTVAYTVGGTADSESDNSDFPNFDPWTRTGTVTFPTGAATIDIVLTPTDDGVAEGPEAVTFQLNKLGPGPYVVREPSSATGTIADDDIASVPTISVIVKEDTATDNPVDPGRFRITRTGRPEGDLKVAFAVSGTAGSGTDYAALPHFDPETGLGYVVLADGQPFVDIDVRAWSYGT